MIKQCIHALIFFIAYEFVNHLENDKSLAGHFPTEGQSNYTNYHQFRLEHMGTSWI